MKSLNTKTLRKAVVWSLNTSLVSWEMGHGEYGFDRISRIKFFYE